MQVGDLVISRGYRNKEHPVHGIIVADMGLSWQKDKMMWRIEWSDGSWCVLHESNLELISKKV